MENKPRTRRQWGSVTRAAVITGALELVDREGLAALSMPRLAKHLETGVMTLYGHVANKADLVDALAERVLSELEVADGDRDWDDELAEQMRGLRAGMLRHPALASVLATRRVATPSAFRHEEAGLALLRSAGFDRRAAVQVYFALLTYTLGFVAWEIPRTHRDTENDYAHEWHKLLAELPADDHPTLHDLAEQLPDAASEPQFEAGLRALLRGFASMNLRG
jgi:AcrR family transcriptional regulator